jgi:hypothetical protein
VRNALNSNPLVQAAAIGVLAVIVGFLLLTRVMGQSEPAPEAAATDPAAATGATPPQAESTAPAADASAPVPDATGVPPTDAAAADPAAEAAAAGEFVAGPGLPAEVVKAYADGKVVVLLVELETGIDDRKLEKTVEALRSRGDTAVFLVPADEIADYSRITQGVDVERTPALVVIRPRRLTEGPTPVASVAYGFRGPQSVDQAVEDALYEGRQDLPYYPE